MKPNDRTLGDYFEGANPFVVPPYQRPYEWDEPRWVDLWRDLLLLYRRSLASSQRLELNGPQHFMGTLIVQTGDWLGGRRGAQLLLVDGQQRIATLFLAEAARRDHAAFLAGIDVDPEPLVRMPRTDVPRVTLTTMDQEAFESAMRGDFVNAVPEVHGTSQTARAYRFFRFQLWRGWQPSSFQTDLPPRPSRKRTAPPAGSYEAWGEPAKPQDSFDLDRLAFILLSGLSFLEVRIEPNDEDAGVIFDTINGKTTPLRQFDHLRNSIFIRMPTRQGPFLKRHWEPAEAALAHVSYSSLRNQPQDQFLYEYLISLGETSTTTGTLHRVFMERVIEKIGFDVTGDSERKFESQFAVPLAREAQLYPLAVGVRTSTRIAGKEIALPAAEAVLIADLMALSGGPPVPLVLRYLRSWEVGKLTNVELRARLMLIQSFVVRMMLHGDNLSPLRAGFISIAGSLPDDSDESLELALKQHGWRADRDIVDSVATVSLTGHYSSAAVMVVLRGIERQLSGRGAHAVPFGKGEELFSIEHVLPQAQDPGRAWRQDLDKWGEPVDLPSSQELRHTLGNLTAVTNYDNSVNGQKPFSVKRGLIAKTAPLRLHSSFKRRQKWTSKEIVERTQALAVAALAHWRGPRQR